MSNPNHNRQSQVVDTEISTDFSAWSDQKLIDSYRRHSTSLIHYGFDSSVVDRMGQVETELRVRDIDPDEIVQDLWTD